MIRPCLIACCAPWQLLRPKISNQINRVLLEMNSQEVSLLCYFKSKSYYIEKLKLLYNPQKLALIHMEKVTMKLKTTVT